MKWVSWESGRAASSSPEASGRVCDRHPVWLQPDRPAGETKKQPGTGVGAALQSAAPSVSWWWRCCSRVDLDSDCGTELQTTNLRSIHRLSNRASNNTQMFLLVIKVTFLLSQLTDASSRSSRQRSCKQTEMTHWLIICSLTTWLIIISSTFIQLATDMTLRLRLGLKVN